MIDLKTSDSGLGRVTLFIVMVVILVVGGSTYIVFKPKEMKEEVPEEVEVPKVVPLYPGAVEDRMETLRARIELLKDLGYEPEVYVYISSEKPSAVADWYRNEMAKIGYSLENDLGKFEFHLLFKRKDQGVIIVIASVEKRTLFLIIYEKWSEIGALWDWTRPPSPIPPPVYVSLSINGASAGSTKFTIIHMGGDTVTKAFEASTLKNLDVRINGVSVMNLRATLKLNGYLIFPSEDFGVGDVLYISDLPAALESNDKIEVIHKLTNQTLAEIKVK